MYDLKLERNNLAEVELVHAMITGVHQLEDEKDFYRKYYNKLQK